MTQTLGLVAIVVREYDEAIAWYTEKLGFELVEDTPQSDVKRWVRVRPPGSTGTDLLLARAANAEQASRIGNQTGERVFLFLYTDDFHRDHDKYRDRGVVFVRPPSKETYGIVAVFEDLYGNKWDLVQMTQDGQAAS
jgi:catechol 2,3-dioxygenase-like lactoylglutathione lyase family enzyme